MNFIKTILDLLLSIFGGKKKTTKPTTPTVEPPKTVTPPPPPEPTLPPEPEVQLPDPIPITEEVMKQTLSLANYDDHLSADNYIKPFLKQYHTRISGTKKLSHMRSGDLFEWVPLRGKPGNSVKALQSFLLHVGLFPPDAECDGFFGYGTQAGVRLFQEYNRIYEGKSTMVPDGVVGKGTWGLMKEWQEAGKKVDKWTRGKPTADFKRWLGLIENAKKHYLNPANAHLITETVNKEVAAINAQPGQQPVDTFEVKDWTADPMDVHLIGIRRNEDKGGKGRINDDVFVLLINGMVFKFWGSTDPKQKDGARQDEAFLVEGQHKFRFGWHNVSAAKKAKLYQGLNPYQRGVLVFRDDKITNDNSLTEDDIKKGLDTTPNTTINIHWTGIGRIGQNDRPTWSVGCQVLAGESYVDNDGKLRDCSSFAAFGSADIQNNSASNIKKTKGAYNVFTDLVLLFRPKDVDYIIYTLGRDDTMQIDTLARLDGGEILVDTLKVLNLPFEIDPEAAKDA